MGLGVSQPAIERWKMIVRTWGGRGCELSGSREKAKANRECKTVLWWLGWLGKWSGDGRLWRAIGWGLASGQDQG